MIVKLHSVCEREGESAGQHTPHTHILFTSFIKFAFVVWNNQIYMKNTPVIRKKNFKLQVWKNKYKYVSAKNRRQMIILIWIINTTEMFTRVFL